MSNFNFCVKLIQVCMYKYTGIYQIGCEGCKICGDKNPDKKGLAVLEFLFPVILSNKITSQITTGCKMLIE